MKDPQTIQQWCKEIADNYTPQQRKNWYGVIASAYNRVRPRYDLKLINRILDLTQLPPDASILEIGCGPGTATTAFAEFGFSMVCLEPSPEAYQFACSNCQKYPHVLLKNTTFEEWELETHQFNAVLAATSFHWVSPEMAYQKAASALKDDGFLILLWNTTLQPPYEVYQKLEDIYQTYAPSFPQYEDIKTQQEYLNQFAEGVLKSGQFRNLVSDHILCEVSYTIDDYLALLTTYTPYIKLDPRQRLTLLTQLRYTLEENCGNKLQLFYLSAFHLAQKA